MLKWIKVRQECQEATLLSEVPQQSQQQQCTKTNLRMLLQKKEEENDSTDSGMEREFDLPTGFLPLDYLNNLKKNLFSQESALPTNTLRRALAESFFDHQNFQLSLINNATECFENILLHIHLHIASSEPENMCSTRHCIPHQKFTMTLVEQSICRICGATSDPLPLTQMVHYVSASVLISEAKQISPTSRAESGLFGQLLRYASGMGDKRDCPSSCGAKIQIFRTLINCPEIVSVGIVWDNECPSLEEVMDVLATVGTSLRVSDVFHNVIDFGWCSSTVHNLIGIVTYHEKHYATFFFHTKIKVWIYFDDINVEEIGPRWEQVVDKFQHGQYQPLLLLYATDSATPFHIENAPKDIMSFSNNPVLEDLKKKEVEGSLKRSITPSPEKPFSYSTSRRAITPNPDNLSHACHEREMYEDYQNFTEIQNNIFEKQGTDVVDDVESKYNRHTVKYVMRQQKKQIQLTRSLSAGSANLNRINIIDHLNVPRRRDSENWSGDRNSASSSSSMTMDSPFSYISNKMQKNSSSSKSLIRKSGEVSSNISGHYDAGYDSYSLSSTDSLPLQQGLKHNLQLFQIPEGYQQVSSEDCEQLWKETDTLMEKAQVAEKDGDLSSAIAFCTAASSKAREAMNIPYSNSDTIDSAKKKHNFCVMKISYLQKKIKQEQAVANAEKEDKMESRHSRENSRYGQHLRQSSRDKENHLRQNWREMMINVPLIVNKPINKSIEIYATLPKKKNLRSKVTSVNVIEDEEYMFHDSPNTRKVFFERSRHCTGDIKEKKRSRSEERNKNISKEFFVSSSKSTKLLKSEKLKELFEATNIKNQEVSSSILSDQKQNKKQHKIRRKLLMSGLIKRKNRSMPDLREKQYSPIRTNSKDLNNSLLKLSVDDSNVGCRNVGTLVTLNGYLSEGHQDFTSSRSSNKKGESSANSNLERSRLMRKSFHGSISKVFHVSKVPPPPPLRTTSQLSKNKLSSEAYKSEHQAETSLNPQTNKHTSSHHFHKENDAHWNHTSANTSLQSDHLTTDYSSEFHSFPCVLSYNMDQYKIELQNDYNNKLRFQDDVVQYANEMHYEPTVVLTRADIHHDQTAIKQLTFSDLPDPENRNVSHSRQSSEEFPPPPYPMNPSIAHSRQTSEEFPPPPSPIEDNHTFQLNETTISQKSHTQQRFEYQKVNSLLMKLKLEKELTRTSEVTEKQMRESQINKSEKKQHKTWLKELKIKQTETRTKRKDCNSNKSISNVRFNSLSSTRTLNEKPTDLTVNIISDSNISRDVTDCPEIFAPSVRDMTAKFEQKIENEKQSQIFVNSPSSINMNISNESKKDYINCVNNFDKDNYLLSLPKLNHISSGPERCSKTDLLSITLNSPHENGLPINYLNGDISEVAMQNTIQNTTILPHQDDIFRTTKKRIGKKKSVSFCDQVVLVATADDNEKDSYIPNPILERVLRTAMNKPETAAVLKEISSLQEENSNREDTDSSKFYQQTLPFKIESDIVTATPFQDQLKNINLVSESIQAVSAQRNLSDMSIQKDNKVYFSCGANHENVSKETYSIYTNEPLKTTSIIVSSCLPEKICYTENAYPKPKQQMISIHPQIETSHLRDQNFPLLETQKFASLSTPLQSQYKQNIIQQKYNNSKNIHSPYYQLEQQINQTNKQYSSQQQKNSINQRLQNQIINPKTVPLQQQQTMMNQKLNNQISSSITVQQPQFSFYDEQYPNSDLHPSQSSHQFQNAYQGYHYQSVPQRFNQPLPQCQSSLNPIENYQYTQLQQENLQNGNIATHKQKQTAHSLNQHYANVQLPLNLKYIPQIKIIEQQTIHKMQKNTKRINSNISYVPKSTVLAVPKIILCHLCRKKQVYEPAIYCVDCDFYMLRFRPKN